MEYEREGVTDAEGRARIEGAFLEALAAHVEDPSGPAWDALRQAADRLVAIGGDHFSSGIGWAREIDVRIGPLLSGDAKTWGILLQGLSRRIRAPGDDIEERFRQASPFRGRLVVYEQSRPGMGPTYHGDIDPILEQAMAGHAPVSLAPNEAMFVLDPPAPVTGPLQPDEDLGSVGC